MIALICLLLVQDTAEATFKKIEDALQKADTIRVVMSGKVAVRRSNENLDLSNDGTLLIKGQDKIRAAMKTKSGDSNPTEVVVKSNGGKMQGPGSALREAPGKLRGFVVATLTRLGPSAAIQAVWGADAKGPAPTKPAVSNLVLKEAVKGVGTLTFDVVHDGRTQKVILEFDEKTHKLLKVTTRRQTQGDGEILVTETLTVELDGEIADKEFDLADRK